MMQWKKDLESLVEQTRAMVRHTNPTGVVPAARAEMPLPEPVIESSPPSKSSPAHHWATPELTWDRPAREEIMQRVEGFRAHQEKLRREREDYYLEMTQKTRAMLQDDLQPKH